MYTSAGGLASDDFAILVDLIGSYRNEVMTRMSSRDRNLITFLSVSLTDAVYEVFKNLKTLPNLYTEAKANKFIGLVRDQVLRKLRERFQIYLLNIEQGNIIKFDTVRQNCPEQFRVLDSTLRAERSPEKVYPPESVSRQTSDQGYDRVNPHLAPPSGGFQNKPSPGKDTATGIQRPAERPPGNQTPGQYFNKDQTQPVEQQKKKQIVCRVVPKKTDNV